MVSVPVFEEPASRSVAAEPEIGYLSLANVQNQSASARSEMAGRSHFQAACSVISASALSAVMKRRLPTL